MIKKLNPEMTDELLAYSVAKMKEYGIVDSGDTLKDGIGAMTDARVASFFDKMVKAGVVKSDIDYRKAYTLRFVNKGVGVESAAEEVDDGSRPRPTSSLSAAGLAVRLRDVTKTYDNGVMALGPLDLEVRKGEFVSLLGPSGCGKSTALRLIAGLAAPSSGTRPGLASCGARARTKSADQHRLRVPGADPDAVGERAGKCAPAAEAGAACRRRNPTRRSWKRWRTSASPNSPTAIRANCPAA